MQSCSHSAYIYIIKYSSIRDFSDQSAKHHCLYITVHLTPDFSYTLTMSVSVNMVKVRASQYLLLFLGYMSIQTRAKMLLLTLGNWILSHHVKSEILLFFGGKKKKTYLKTLKLDFLKVRLMRLGINSFHEKNKKCKGLLQQPKGNCALMNCKACNKLAEAINTTDRQLCPKTWQ